jgi:hypothetical protein
MKQSFTLGVLMLTGMSLFSQSLPFFEGVNYRGAFAPAPAARWTDGWANFTPQQTNYPATTVSVNGNLTVNTTWTSNNVYLLNDALVYVEPGVTLTIQPGTIIRGTGKGTLIVERGAKIVAEGTANAPIVFTSNQPAGARDYGDWGGVVICGAAPHNRPTGPNAEAEGGIGNAATQRGVFGGNSPEDSSGILAYVRIEFCGISLTPQSNSEINGLSLYGVGSKTSIHHIQVSYSGDDAFEWFGGTVDGKYLFAYRTWDDDFDTDNGFKGRIQFAAAIRDSKIADQSGSNGFESDNDADGSLNTPITAPVFSNVTFIGPIYQNNPDSVNSLYRRALHIRRNSSIRIFNSIFTGFNFAGLNLDSRRTVSNACNDSLIWRYNILAGMGTDFRLSSGDTLCIANVNDLTTWAMDAARGTDTLPLSEDVLLTNPYDFSNPDLRPLTQSPALTGPVDFAHPVLLPLLQTTGIVGIKDIDISLYPNPTADILHIQTSKSLGEQLVSLTDLSGRRIYTENHLLEGGVPVTIHLKDIPSGVYQVQFAGQSRALMVIK